VPLAPLYRGKTGHLPSVPGGLLTASMVHVDGGVLFFYAPRCIGPSINIKEKTVLIDPSAALRACLELVEGVTEGE